MNVPESLVAAIITILLGIFLASVPKSARPDGPGLAIGALVR